MRRIAWFGQTARHVDRGLNRVVERATDPQHLCISQAAGLGEPAQAGVVSQRGRCENPGPSTESIRVVRVVSVVSFIACAGRRSRQTQQFLSHCQSNVERRFDQPQLLTNVDPAHRPRLARMGETFGVPREACRPLVQPHEVRSDFADSFQRDDGVGASRMQSVQCRHPVRGHHLLRGFAGPAQLGSRPGLAHHQPQVARRALQRRHQLLPVGQPARQLQTGRQHVAPEVQQLAGCQVRAKKLHTGFIQLVGFVKDRDPHRGQQFSHARFTHRQIGEKEVVIDHHNVGGHGLAPRQADVTGAELRALRAQAVLPGGRHQRNDRRALVQSRQFSQVTGACDEGPGFDTGQRPGRSSINTGRILPRLLHPVQAQIAGAAFEQRGAHRQPQRLHQARQIAPEQLVLERLGGSRNQHPLAAQKRRHQIRKGFADAGACFDHQRPTVFDGTGHGQRHVGLPGARLELGLSTGKHALRRKSRRRRLLELRQHQAGSLGSSASSSRMMLSRNASRRFFSRRSMSSSIGGSRPVRSIKAPRSPCSMRNSIRRRAGE